MRLPLISFEKAPHGRLYGHTQGSSRDTEHHRHLNRIARKARRVERLHRHTATGRKRMRKASGP